MRLLTEIDGQAVPLDECDWVLWMPCGCAGGVTVARLSLTEEDAWKEFFDRKRDRDRKRRQGYRMELVTQERWKSEISESMRKECPHKKESR